MKMTKRIVKMLPPALDKKIWAQIERVIQTDSQRRLHQKNFDVLVEKDILSIFKVVIHSKPEIIKLYCDVSRRLERKFPDQLNVFDLHEEAINTTKRILVRQSTPSTLQEWL